MRELRGEVCPYEHSEDLPDAIYDSARTIRMDDYPYTDSVGLVDHEKDDGFFSGVYSYETWLKIRELDESVTVMLIEQTTSESREESPHA